MRNTIKALTGPHEKADFITERYGRTLPTRAARGSEGDL